MGKTKSNLPSSINFLEESVSNNKDIAEKFNDYFSSIASKLASDIGPARMPFESFLPQSVPFTFYLKPTSEQEILMS